MAAVCHVGFTEVAFLAYSFVWNDVLHIFAPHLPQITHWYRNVKFSFIAVQNDAMLNFQTCEISTSSRDNLNLWEGLANYWLSKMAALRHHGFGEHVRETAHEEFIGLYHPAKYGWNWLNSQKYFMPNVVKVWLRNCPFWEVLWGEDGETETLYGFIPTNTDARSVSTSAATVQHYKNSGLV